MRRISFLVIASFLSLHLQAENDVAEIMRLVEQNNTTLQAMADQIETAKQETRMENSLDDPELGFDYLWGKPGFIGMRKDVNIQQSFNLATLFGYRRKLAHTQQDLLDLNLLLQRIETQMQALDLLVQLTYYNLSVSLYEERLQQAEQLALFYEKRLKAGDTNKLEVNRVRLDRAEVEADYSRCCADRDLLLLELKRLSGGTEIHYDGRDYALLDQVQLPSLRTVREAQGAQQQVIADADLRVSRAESLPTISAGYMAELTDDEKWRGVTLSVSIPLWGNRQNLRRARLQQQAAHSDACDVSFQLEQAAEMQRLRTERYQDIARRLALQLEAAASEPLLRKALQEGEISLVDYLIQVADLFELRQKCLEADKDYQQARILLAGMIKSSEN